MNQIDKLKLWLLFFGFLIATNLFAQNKNPDLEKYFSALAKNQEFNGNVLIAENGKIIYQKSFGYADFGTKRLNTKESLFNIMSITKTFTATAILQLQEKGKLKVSDFVSKYLPEFPYPTITIKHLLSHTSGLPSYDKLFDSLRLAHPDTIFTNKDIVPRYAALKLPLLYQPGEDGNYDNVNFIFLAIILEKVAGISFQDYLKNNIFKPIGIKNSILPRFAFFHYTNREKKNLSFLYRFPHSYSEKLVKTDTISFVSKYWHNYNFSGFGEMLSTTEDLLKYDQALYNGKLLSRTTLNEVFTPVNLNNGKENPVGNGLGWHLPNDKAFRKLVMHSGGGMGVSSILLRNITKNQTIIIIDNMHSQASIFVNGIAFEVLKIMNGQTIKPLGKSVAREYAKVLINKGIEQANVLLENLRKDTVNYSISEGEFNSLGYDFMREDKILEALETFKTNIKLFPQAWNPYDSYGEALLTNGQKEEAIKMYQKSIELNPKNENGKKILEQIPKPDK